MATMTGYQDSWDYNRRYNLYDAVRKQEGLSQEAIDYFEFGVASGVSFKWWLEKNRTPPQGSLALIPLKDYRKNGAPSQRCHGAHAESLQISDSRATFYKGLFQQTLIPFLEPIRATE
jgi:O-methyltransferase